MHRAGIATPLPGFLKDLLAQKLEPGQDQESGFDTTGEGADKHDETPKDEIIKFLIEADQLKCQIKYEIKDKVIGKLNEQKVFEITGDFADLQNVARIFAPFFTPAMVEIELRKINLALSATKWAPSIPASKLTLW